METELMVGSKYKFWTPGDDSYGMVGIVISVHGSWVKIERGGVLYYVNLAHIESIEVYK